MKRFRIRDWDSRYEKAQTRKCAKVSWVPVPVKHDGLGFRRLMRLPDGVQVYGAWVMILQLAAKCPLRGTLVNESGPLTYESMETITGAPAEVFERACKVLSGSEIGWILVDDYQPATSALPLQDRTIQDKTLQESAALAPSGDGCPPELLAWMEWWNSLRAEDLVHAGVATNPPGEATLRAWRRIVRSKELRPLFADREQIDAAIRRSRFVRKAEWFTFCKLLGGKNKEGEYVVSRLLAGGYEGNGMSRSEAGDGFSISKILDEMD